MNHNTKTIIINIISIKIQNNYNNILSVEIRNWAWRQARITWPQPMAVTRLARTRSEPLPGYFYNIVLWLLTCLFIVSVLFRKFTQRRPMFRASDDVLHYQQIVLPFVCWDSLLHMCFLDAVLLQCHFDQEPGISNSWKPFELFCSFCRSDVFHKYAHRTFFWTRIQDS